MTGPPLPGLRPACPEDADFLARLFALEASDSLRALGLPEPEVAALVAMQAHGRAVGTRVLYPKARSGIVTCEGRAVGRFVEADVSDPPLVHVVDLAIDPAWRRRGLAAALLRAAMARWAAAGRGGRAQVGLGNAASLALFAGLGFTGAAQPGAAQVCLHWRPG